MFHLARTHAIRPPTSPESVDVSRRARIILIALASMLVLAGIGLALLPTIAGGAIESKATEILSAREDLDVTWGELRVDWSGALIMTDVTARDVKRGVEATIARVEVSPELGTALSETPRLDAIEVEGVVASVDADVLVEALTTPREGDGSGGDPTSLRARFMRELIESPPEITLRDVKARARYGGADWLEVSTDEASVTGEDATWRVVAKGTANAAHERLPRPLKRALPWAVDLTLGIRDRHAQVTLSSGEEGKPLVALSLPKVGHARVGKVTVDAALEDRVASLEVEGLDVAAGSEDAPIVALQAARMRAEVGTGERPVVTLTAPALTVDPGRLGKLREVRAALAPSVAGAVAGGVKARIASKEEASQSALDRAMVWARRGVDALWWVDLEAQDGTFVAAFAPKGDNPGRRLELVQGLEVRASGGVIEARGESAGGVFETTAAFTPGSPLPIGASLKLTSVDIDEIPGMAQGRTLPNRGVRGTIGGHFDAEVNWVAPGRGGVDTYSGLDEGMLTVSFDWREGMIDLDGLADEPLTGIKLGTDAVVRWSPRLSRWRLTDGELRYGELKAHYEAELTDWWLEPELTARVELEEARCHDIVHSLPDALLGPYHRVIFKGTVAPVVTLEYPIYDPMRLELVVDNLSEEDNPEWRRKWRRANRDATDPFPAVDKNWACSVDRMRVTREGWPEITIAPGPGSLGQARPKRYPPAGDNPSIHADVYWLNRPFVKRVVEGVTEDAEIDVGPGLATYVPLKAMPAYVGASMYLSEEILFYQNRGISLGLIEKAIRIDLERGRFVYGGSTVTQQLVKNLFLTRDKTIARKIQEAIIALRIDEVVSKDRVLELYVNVIEFGRDLYGIGPAAQHYFQKPATELSPMEAVFLAVIKPSPRYGQHLMRRGSTPSKGWMHKRIGTIFKRLVKYELLTQEEADAQLPYVLKWDKDGNYIEPEPKVPLLTDDDPTGLELIENLFDDPR